MLAVSLCGEMMKRAKLINKIKFSFVLCRYAHAGSRWPFPFLYPITCFPILRKQPPTRILFSVVVAVVCVFVFILWREKTENTQKARITRKRVKRTTDHGSVIPSPQQKCKFYGNAENRSPPESTGPGRGHRGRAAGRPGGRQ